MKISIVLALIRQCYQLLLFIIVIICSKTNQKHHKYITCLWHVFTNSESKNFFLNFFLIFFKQGRILLLRSKNVSIIIYLLKKRHFATSTYLIYKKTSFFCRFVDSEFVKTCHEGRGFLESDVTIHIHAKGFRWKSFCF